MAKPNYQFEKRQRDLAKKNKREEKLRQKQAVKPGDSSGENETTNPPSPPSHAGQDGCGLQVVQSV